MRGLFVTGTGTGVGKTVAAAAIFLRYRDRVPGLRYWKPIQTGIEQDDDTATVARLIGSDQVLDAGIRLPRPLSPHLAARLAGRAIDIEAIAAVPGPGRAPMIVEGAGGVLVPHNESALIVDLMIRLDLPALVVAASGLGTINHTLLTIEALRSRRLAVAGVLMVGSPNEENRAAIEAYGRVLVVGVLPPLDPLTPATLAAAASGLDPTGHLQACLS